MYEVEAKVPLTKSDFLRLQKQLKKTAKFKEKSLKKDIYYNNPKEAFIRIRKEGKNAVFNIKDKGVKKGIEANIEMEWGIKDKEKWTALLNKLGIKASIRKTKKTEAYQLNGFNIELNHVVKLGYFLEIERIVRSKKQIPKAKKELIDIFRNFGYSQKDFEKRYYLDLLQSM